MTTTKNRRCADCGTPCTGQRCAQHAAAARIGKPRGVADPNRKRPKELSTRQLYPLPIPSDDTRPLTFEELGKAKCKGNAEVYDVDGAATVHQKIMCHGCPIQARCLAVAIAFPEPVGVWGGATVAEREKIRRKMVRTNA